MKIKLTMLLLRITFVGLLGQIMPKSDQNPYFMAANSTLSTVKNHFMRNIFKPLLFLAAFFMSAQVWGQTFYNMSSANYSQNFSDMANWTNNYAAGTGAANWRVATSVATSTVNTATVFAANATAGGVHKGTESMILLATGTNSSATDLLLNFTGRNAGTISLDWAKVTNTVNASPRSSDLKIQYSINNGTTFADLTGYTFPRVLNNNTAESGSISSISLPSALNNQSQVVIRFYVWNNGQTGGSGNRPKIQIDNVSVTSTASGFTVTFDGNGNTGGTMANQTANTTTALNANTFTRSGYDFAGWNTAADGSGTAYAGGANFPFTANATLYAQWTLSATPSITVTETPTAFSTTYGTASAHQDFTITGSNLSADISVAALTGFEYSTNGGISYSSTATLPATGGTLRVRLAATAAAGTYNNLNIALASGVTNQNITTTASSNVVNQKALTITSLSAANKTYDATTSVSVTGTPQYVGLENGETFSVTGSVTWAHGNKNVGPNKTLTRTGNYNAPSANYTVTQPSLSASISAATLTINSPTATNRPYNGLTTVTVSGTLATVLGSDAVSLSTTGTVATATAANGKVVTFAISGADAGNYTLTQPGTTVNITKVTLTATADNKTKIRAMLTLL